MEARTPAALKLMAYGWIAWFLLPFAILAAGFFGRFSAASAVFSDPRFWAAFWISLSSAFIVVIISAVFAVPAAYALAYGRFRNTFLIETLMIDIPQTLPPVAVGVVYLFAFGPGSPLALAYTFAAVVIAKIVVAAPFALSHTLRRFRQIKETKLDLIARSLGADTNQVLLRVLVPMSKRDIAAGLTLTWARAMGEFGGSLIFAGVIAYKTENLPTYTNRISQGDPYMSLGATVIMVVFALFALVAIKKLSDGKRP